MYCGSKKLFKRFLMDYLKEDNVLICKKGAKSLSVNCMIPKIEPPEILPANVGVAYLYSPYFCAASNYFSIKIQKSNNQDEYWGMLYPMVLFDNENSILYNGLKKYQLSMLFSAFCSFVDLALNVGKLKFDTQEDCYNYADFATEESVFVFIYDKTVYADFNMIIGAFYDFGFYFIDNPYATDKFYKSEYQNSIFESQSVSKTLVLRKYSPIFEGFGYLENMYKRLLPRVESPLFRYFILYQVIEYLMEEKKDEVLFDELKSFSGKQKNDIRERIQSCLKEQNLIENLYSGVPHTNGIYADFCDKAKVLFEKVGKELPKAESFISYMYGVRNIIVHNFKSAMENEELVKKLSEMFEKAIYELLVKVNIKKVDNKKIFVMDRLLSYKENKRNFYKVYHN